MKNLLILIIIFAVVVLGYWVYQDAEMKKKNKVNQLIHEAQQSLNIVKSYPDNFMPHHDKVAALVQSSERWMTESNHL
ncbi:hypothetical protein AY606_02850 [Acinetobacter sp. SFB]|uniref:hypothetical protein n=1 Tax=Acinetobacter sp. SFB TaxID=1805634 RepID=UPI0007D86190|nr:hypothetical protein [Acinetobacter sp. SFB]OAL81684.1 hypothetical protein AY606_02850 [Acinetobacter sp. SFB]